MVEFFVNERGLMLAGVRIQFGLLLVIHEDTATTIDIRPLDGCTPREPMWQGEELLHKLLMWNRLLRDKQQMGIDAYLRRGAR